MLDDTAPAPAATGPATDLTLSVRDLRITYHGSAPVQAVRGVSFDLRRGETLGLVGESGSGKSTTILGAVGLLPGTAEVTHGEVIFQGRDLGTLSAAARRDHLGRDIGIVYQDALRSLNPVMRVGSQIKELLVAHGRRAGASQHVIDTLRSVWISDPETRARAYPHEFSGGMRQRAMIGMGLAMAPALLIADEPTTAVDVTTQAQILALIRTLATDHGTATVIVSHDLGVIAGTCDRVAVMYAGEIVEQAPVDELFTDPKHPYTRLLLSSTPDLGRARQRSLPFIPGQPPDLARPVTGCAFADRCDVAEAACATTPTELAVAATDHLTTCTLTRRAGGTLPFQVVVREPADSGATAASRATPGAPPGDAPPLLVLDGVRREYPIAGGLGQRRRRLVAVDGVSLEIAPGTSLGLVGESGCGKSTLGRMIAGLDAPTGGRIVFDGRDVTRLGGRALRAHRRRVQIVYQDPRNSLNRSMTIGQLLAEPLRQNGLGRLDRHRRSRELIEQVGLSAMHLERRPNELSGGQNQRVAIARALAVGADVLVADEAVSSLDMSVKGQILNLLGELQRELGLTIVFISHDLSVVRHLCDRVAVMYLGRLVEVAPSDALFAHPSHPYTRALHSAIPVPSPSRERARTHIVLHGETPSPADPPAGCTFHPRCQVGPIADPTRTRCTAEPPALTADAGGHACACHYATDGAVPEGEG